jgi:hypothetical protein
MLFYELDADELDELTPWLREMPARTRSFSGYTSELMRPCGTTNCLDQLTPRSSRPQRAGEINTRLQIARLPAPSIFDAPKGGQSLNQRTHEVTLTHCGHDDADQGKVNLRRQRSRSYDGVRSDVKLS